MRCGKDVRRDMVNGKENPKVDAFLDRQTRWQPEMKRLRAIALGCGLDEEIKWGKPCYVAGGNNIVLIQGFTKYCALLFFKGALLEDPGGILQKVGPNSRIGMQARFTDVNEIDAQTPTLKACVRQAIEVERSGAEVDLEQAEPRAVPEELQQRLDQDPALRAAFDALTPGRQRGYLIYFSDAKQSKTRSSRIEKYVPRILDGLGLHDA